MERAVSDDTRQFMIMAIIKTHQNIGTLDASELASVSMMDDEDLIYELGEGAILLSKYVADSVSKAKEVINNHTTETDGSI